MTSEGPEFQLPEGLVVPDDASSLELDRLALERERVQQRRRARLRRVFLTRRYHNHGISGPIVSLCLLVVFVFAALLAFVVPGPGNARPGQQPLATSTARPGTPGSLLPVETLLGVGRNRQDELSTDLRPGVVLLIPAACDTTEAARAACADGVRSVTTGARNFNLRTWLVGGAQIRDLVELAEAPASADTYAIPLEDRTGAVIAAFPSSELPTAVLVAADGAVSEVHVGVDGATSLDAGFNQLSGVP